MEKADIRLVIAAFTLLALMFFYDWQQGVDVSFEPGGSSPAPQIAP
jgi:hypothetical protein